MRHDRTHLVAIFVPFGMYVLAASCHAAGFPELEFLARLRQQRSYREVEIHGERLWQSGDLTVAQRCELAIELAETFAQQACATPLAERAAVWEKAEHALSRFDDRVPESPKNLLIDIQRALLLLMRGDLERIEAGCNLCETDYWQSAQEHLRRSIGLLNGALITADEQISDRVGPTRPRAGADSFSVKELEAVRHNLRFHLGRAHFVQGLCYPAKSADRVNALQLALEQLQHHVGQPGNQRVTWQARVATVAALRELAELSRAEAFLVAWQQENPPSEVADRLAAEQLRLQLAKGETEPALKSGRQLIETAGAQSGHVHLAYLEVLLAAGDSNRTNDEQTWTKKVTDQLARIRKGEDALLVRQAESLVGQSFADRASVQSAELLELAAESLYYSGRIDDALRTFDRAVALLRSNGAADRAFELKITAAAIEHHRRDLAAAVRRYVSAARTNAAHPRAAEAHFTAILLQADVARNASPGDQMVEFTDYSQLLDKHLRQWPEASSTNDVRWWRAKLHMADQNWDQAVQLLTAMEPSHERFIGAIDSLSECYSQLLSAARQNFGASSPQVQHTLTTATSFLQPIITGRENHWPVRWTEAQVIVAAGLAHLHSKFGEHDSNYAYELLRAVWPALKDIPADPPLRERIGLLNATVLVAHGALDEARQLISEPWAESPSLKLVFVAQLAEGLGREEDTQRTNIAQLALNIIENLPSELVMSPAERVALLRHEAEALVAVGRLREARDRYRQLAESHPHVGEIHEAYASLLSRGESAESRREAFAQWTAVEQRSRPGGERWLRARKARIQLLHKSGNAAEATKLQRLTDVLY